jgi:hypothetical protein
VLCAFVVNDLLEGELCEGAILLGIIAPSIKPKSLTAKPSKLQNKNKPLRWNPKEIATMSRSPMGCREFALDGFSRF